MEALAAALDRFTLAYAARTQVERDRLDFEMRRDERHRQETATRLKLNQDREARIAAKRSATDRSELD